MGKKSRPAQEVNASSMADIAFLLLIFFLVTTTINVDKGILHKLPPKDDEPPEVIEFNQNNVMNILVNKFDQMQVRGDLMEVDDLREKTKEFLQNYGRNPDLSDNPQKAVVSLKNDRGTSYNIYIRVQNELKAAYRECRDEYAMNKFGKTYLELTELQNDKKIPKAQRTDYKDKAKSVREEYPMRLSEAEPESIGS